MSPNRSREQQQEFLPHFRSRPGDPVVPDGVVGIRIATTGPEASTAQRRWPLHGTFRVPRAAMGAEPEAVLRRIVLVLTSGSTGVQARHAFRDELIFAEDVQVVGQSVAGSFHVDLLRVFEFRVPRDVYFFVASVGEYVSDVISCEAVMSWLIPAPQKAVPEEESRPDEDEVAKMVEDEDDGDTSWMVDEPF